MCTDVIDRHLFVADARQSVSVLSLAAPGHWRVLGQSLEPRPATCMRCLDPVTVCVADKFGGVQILRLPPVSDVPLQAPVRGPGGAFEMDTGGVAVLQPVASLNVGSVVMSVEKLTLSHAAVWHPLLVTRDTPCPTRTVMFGAKCGGLCIDFCCLVPQFGGKACGCSRAQVAGTTEINMWGRACSTGVAARDCTHDCEAVCW